MLFRRAAAPLFALLFAALAAGCGGSSTEAPGRGAGESEAGPPRRSVKLLLNWFPEAEHGGYYAALVNGGFARAGLDVAIQPGGPGTPVAQQVALGQFEFGILNADGVIQARSEEAPLVCVFAPLQTSPRCIMVHKKSGITEFGQIRNMTLAMSSSQPFALFLRKRFPLEGVQIVPYPGNVVQFLRDENFAQQGYVFSEPFVAESQGGDPHVLMVSDLGFNPYTSCLVCTEDLIRKEPELVRAFVAACAAGWKEYLASPGAVHEHIHKINPEMSREVLDYGAKALAPLVRGSGKTPIGIMVKARWVTLLEQLVEIGEAKPGMIDVEDLFTTAFLPHELAP